jgi:hypothetical protein
MSIKRRRNHSARLNALIRATSVKPKVSELLICVSKSQILSSGETLVIAYKAVKYNEKYLIKEITTVAYVTMINNQDYTVVYYDNVHNNKLHMHTRVSVNDKTDTTIPLGVRKNNNQNKLLNWAINDIRQRWIYFRKAFYIRSGLKSDL